MQKVRKTSKLQKLQPISLHMVKSQTQILSKETQKILKKIKYKEIKKWNAQKIKKCKMSLGGNDNI